MANTISMSTFWPKSLRMSGKGTLELRFLDKGAQKAFGENNDRQEFFPKNNQIL